MTRSKKSWRVRCRESASELPKSKESAKDKRSSTRKKMKTGSAERQKKLFMRTRKELKDTTSFLLVKKRRKLLAKILMSPLMERT